MHVRINNDPFCVWFSARVHGGEASPYGGGGEGVVLRPEQDMGLGV